MSLATAACGSAVSPPNAPAVEPANTAVPDTVPPASASAAVGAASGSAVVAAPAVPAKVETAAPTSRFIAVAALPGAAYVFAVNGGLVVAREETAELGPDGSWGNQLGLVQGDVLSFKDGLGLQGVHRVVHVSGTLPHGLDVLATGDTGRTGIAEHYVFRGTQFVPSSEKVGYYHVGVAQVGASLLSLQAPTMPIPPAAPKVVTMRGPALSYKLLPTPKSCVVEEGRIPLVNALSPLAFAATGTGVVAAYGSSCDDKAVIELWEKPGKPSVLVPVGGAPDSDAKLVGGAGAELWLLAGTGVQRYSGGSWSPVVAPPAPLSEGAVAPDGALWAVAASGALVVWRDGQWATELLPDGAKAAHLAIDKEGVVWVTTATGLLRTRRADDGAGVKLAATDKAPAARKQRLMPGSRRCTQNVAVLYGFTKTTPEDYDFPLTRKAVKGHQEFATTRFVVTKDGGQRFFAALVPDFDTGKKLVQLIERNVVGSKPQLLCAEPEILRELKLNLATGEVVK